MVASQKFDPLAALRATDESRTIRHEQAVEQSLEWTREAQEARHANNLDRALDLFARAADLDPTNTVAIQGRDALLEIPSRQTRVPDTSNAVITGSSQIRYHVQSNLDDVKSAILQKQWKVAQTAIKRARLAAESDPSRFTVDDMRDFHDRIAQAELDLRNAMERAGTPQK